MKNMIFNTLLLFFFIQSNIAQNESFSQIVEIRNQLSQPEQKELSTAERITKDGDDLMESGEKKLNESRAMKAQSNKKRNLKKAKKIEQEGFEKKIKGSNKYAEANKLIYNLYKNNLAEIGKKKSAIKKEQVVELEKQADAYYKDASFKRKKAEIIKDLQKKFSLMAKADQLETDAISIQIQAYSIYLGWADADATDDIAINEHKQSETKIQEVKIVNNNQQPRVIYKVQIAASKTPLSIEKLRKIYPSNEIINNEKQGEWYKYSVGAYDTYEEAYQAKKRINVPGAFIVAYKEGEKVNNITDVCNPADHPALHIGRNNEIEYRLQIAYSKNTLSNEQVSSHNKSNSSVKLYYNGAYYKYTIGSFKTYQEAVNFQKQNGYLESNSKVVVYQNEREVNVAN